MANEFYKEAKPRFESQQAQLLSILKARGESGVSGSELTVLTHRFGGTIHRLRDEGYTIDVIRREGGNHLYILKDVPLKPRKKEKAIDLLLRDLQPFTAFEVEEALHRLGLSVQYRQGTNGGTK